MKILKNNSRLLAVAFVLIAAIVVVWYLMTGTGQDMKNNLRVSMIVYGDDSERWENMREGAALVCGENDADISLITMLSENDAGEQEEIIAREIDDGADALIIAACNSKEVKRYVDSKRLRIPVVYVETIEALSGTDENIAADDYSMGYELGEEVLSKESSIVTVAVVSENTQRDSVALREKGFMDAIGKGQTAKIINWTNDNNTDTRLFIQKAVVSEATDVIITFDNSTTDALIDALSNLNMNRKVYAISTSNKSVYNLNNKDILALEYPDEFSMGYLAAMYAVGKSDAGKQYSDSRIEYRIVRKENMYDEDNQTLLFPFVN